MRFLIGVLYGLLLEARYLDCLWFVTTYPRSKYSKQKKTYDIQVNFAQNSK